MNIACTYQGRLYNIIEIRPSEHTGYIELTYVSEDDDLMRRTIVQEELIATDVTSINGRLTT